jgi:hypothetical protein
MYLVKAYDGVLEKTRLINLSVISMRDLVLVYPAINITASQVNAKI